MSGEVADPVDGHRWRRFLFLVGLLYGPQLLGHYVSCTVVLLERSFHYDHRLQSGDLAILVINLGPEDDVHQAMFILQRDEDVSLGCTWHLPADHTARYPYFSARRDDRDVRTLQRILGDLGTEYFH